jgi:hypothetical protein
VTLNAWPDKLGTELVSEDESKAKWHASGRPTLVKVRRVEGCIGFVRARRTREGEKEARKGSEELRPQAGRARQPWRRGGGIHPIGPYRCEQDGASGSKGKRRSRRSRSY